MEALYASFCSFEMVQTRALAASNHPNGSLHLLKIFNFFEQLGRAQEKGIIEVDDLYEFFRDPILLYWYAWEDWVKERRIQEGEDPDDGKQFEHYQHIVELFYDEIKENRLTEAEIKNYLAFEIARYKEEVRIRRGVSIE
jgi:hypothetical protein